MDLSQLPVAAPFIDTRVIHAPAKVAEAMLEDFLIQRGFQVQPSASQDGQRRLPNSAVRPSSGWKSIFQTRPKEVRYAIEPIAENRTRIRLRAGYGIAAEAGLLISAILLWSVFLVCWSYLMSHRTEFQSGGRLAQVGSLPAILILATIWILPFTWLWSTASRLTRLSAEFYEFLSKEGSLQHFAEMPVRFSWPGFLQMLTSGLGLAALAVHLVLHIPAGERLPIAALFLGLFTLIPFLLFIGPVVSRWLLGQVAFTTTSALTLGLLFPMILWALAVNELPRTSDPAASNGHYSLLVGALLALGFAFFAMHIATRNAMRLAQNLDYWREHSENSRWAAGWQRIMLCVMVLPLSLVTGGLFMLAFVHSSLALLNQIHASSALGGSVLFDKASFFWAELINHLLAPLGLKHWGKIIAPVLLVAFATPVLAWGIAHLWAFCSDVVRHARVWQLPSLPKDRAMAQAMALLPSSGLSYRSIRLSRDVSIHAYAAIAPLPFLPKLIVLSAGALRQLPPRCVAALIAHELGHIRCGHTRSYEVLRFVSRVLFLGPSFFTALLQPSTQLEADADQIAVRLLETNGGSRQDLIEALRQIEQNQIGILLPWGWRQGVAIAAGPGMDWMPGPLRTAMESESTQPLFVRLITRWRLLFYMTQHSDLAGYTYESFSQRIDRMSKLT